MTRQEAARILGVSPNASAETARAAYKRLMQVNHPDKGGDEEKAKNLTSAWRVFAGRSDANGFPESDEVIYPEFAMNYGMFDAVRKDDPNAVRSIAAGQSVDFRMRDHQGESLLHAAARHNSCQVLPVLVELGADINARRVGYPLWQVTPESADTPLHVAIERRSRDAAIMLIEMGANPDIQDVLHGRSPLHMAAIFKDADIVSTLVRHGAKVNVRDVDGETPMFLALANSDFETVRILHDCGTDAHLRSASGHSPLHMAVKNRHIEVIAGLAKGDTDANVRDENGDTPLHWAADMAANAHLDSYSVGSYLSGLDKNRDVCEIIDVLVECGANVNARNNNGESPLHKAAVKSTEVTDILLKHGASVDARDNDGMTPIHHVAQRSRFGQKSLLAHLARKGADVNARDLNGHTPLDFATADTPRQHRKGSCNYGTGEWELRRRGGKFGEDFPDNPSLPGKK